MHRLWWADAIYTRKSARYPYVTSGGRTTNRAEGRLDRAISCNSVAAAIEN